MVDFSKYINPKVKRLNDIARTEARILDLERIIRELKATLLVHQHELNRSKTLLKVQKREQ